MKALYLTAVILSLLVSHSTFADETPQALKDRQAARERVFAEDVYPLLEKKCFGCHGGGDELEGALDLTSRQGMLKGGDTASALVPGDAQRSPMHQALHRNHDTVSAMPPKDRNALNEREITLIQKWIDADAVWIDPEVYYARAKPAGGQWSSAEGIVVATSGGQSPTWTNRKYQPDDVWAYQPIQNPDVPWSAVPEGFSTNAIDAFILDKLQHTGIKGIAPAADRRTLIRRLTLDLTGLPPIAEEVDAFVNDESADAYGVLVDRLLASPHYGEQLARQWLDVVRYADTAGYANDFERPHAWRYRDYVIRSFNADKPFDEFIVEQIAGDELDSTDPEHLIAVGYLRMGPWEHTGMSVEAVTRQLFLDDITNNVGVTFLGQGLRCCKCHDHKFDPLPTRDYYRMQAVFSPVQFVDRKVPYLSVENVSAFDETRKQVERKRDDARQQIKEIQQKSSRAIDEWLKERGYKTYQDAPKDERPQRNRYGLTKQELSEEKILNKRISYFDRELKRFDDWAFSVYSGPARPYKSNNLVHALPSKQQRTGNAPVIHILKGGAIETPADAVDPGVLTAMAGANDALSPTEWNTIPDETDGRRLALAQWIASDANTLTARVIVNRIWQRHFGTGLVASPNNFGKMGAKPSHPELLDHLATWLIDHDWSVKQLDRLIVTSQTYRQASDRPDRPHIKEQDTRNALLAYYPTRRLAAEELRDSLLAITGELNPEQGGPGIYPKINWEVALQPRHIMGSVAPSYIPSLQPEQRHRRTIYAFRYRTLSDPMLDVFNRPGSETSCEQRDETTVTPQVFALFNGEFVNDRALALADRIMQQTGDATAQQVDAAFQTIYGRLPSEEEKSLAVAHIQKMQTWHKAHPPEKVAPPRSVVREMVEELTGESIRWTEELIGMDEYIPDLKPWDLDARTRALAEVCLVLMNSNEFVYVR